MFYPAVIVQANPYTYQILSRLVQDRLGIAKSIHQDQESPINFTELSTQTEGYSATDLKDLVSRAIHEVAMKASADATQEVCAFAMRIWRRLIEIFVSLQLKLTQADFTAAQIGFVPLSLRDIKLEKSDVAWSDIGGM